jgi:hypothetical protein
MSCRGHGHSLVNPLQLVVMVVISRAMVLYLKPVDPIQEIFFRFRGCPLLSSPGAVTSYVYAGRLSAHQWLSLIIELTTKIIARKRVRALLAFFVSIFQQEWVQQAKHELSHARALP